MDAIAFFPKFITVERKQTADIFVREMPGVNQDDLFGQTVRTHKGSGEFRIEHLLRYFQCAIGMSGCACLSPLRS